MTTTQDLVPTPEQLRALTLFATGDNLALEARAGAGKTSTLSMLAHSTPRRGLYVAFNKSIVADVGPRMPGSVVCSTAHSLAYRAVGAKFRHRLNGNRIRSDEIARILRVDPFVIRYGQQTKVLQPGYLGGLAMRAISVFCNSDDDEPSRMHVPYVDGIDEPLGDGRRGNANNRELAALLEPALRRAWADLQDPAGRLRYSHDVYLKQWALTRPQLGVDYVLADEAQDLSPVMVGVLFSQRSTQIVAVGDSAQNIYGWRGSVDAMRDERLTARSTLSMSFRFGPAVAEVANRVLAMLDSDPPVEGTNRVASVVGPVADPNAILCRTNAAAVDAVLAAQQAGGRPHLVGGGSEVVSFAKAALELQQQGRCWHPELACFDSWNEVVDYVEHDQLGGELRLMVNLVEKYGVPTILRALEHMPLEEHATVVVSTAHKAKGREFDSVRLAGDFPQRAELPGEPAPSDAELRLLYVAATRAKRELDVTACSILTDPEDEAANVDSSPLALTPIETTLDAKALTDLYGTRRGGQA